MASFKVTNLLVIIFCSSFLLNYCDSLSKPYRINRLLVSNAQCLTLANAISYLNFVQLSRNSWKSSDFFSRKYNEFFVLDSKLRRFHGNYHCVFI